MVKDRNKLKIDSKMFLGIDYKSGVFFCLTWIQGLKFRIKCHHKIEIQKNLNNQKSPNKNNLIFEFSI